MDLKIKELCDQRGIKSAYELAKKTGYDHKKDKQDAGAFNMPTAYRAYANNIQRFELETLATLCRVLDCTPNDIFGFESPQNKPVVTLEPRSDGSDAKTRNVASSGLNRLPEGDEWLSTLQVAERLGVSRKSVNDYIVDGKLPATKGKQGHNFVKLDDVLIYQSVYK